MMLDVVVAMQRQGTCLPGNKATVGQATIFHSKSKLCYNLQSVSHVLVSGTHLGPVINFSFTLKFSLDSCGFVNL
jgi:hypothetical protein